MSNDHAYVCNVEGAVTNGGEYLIGTRSQHEAHAAGDLSLIGGTVEPTDDARDILKETVRREIREETTIEVADEIAYVESDSFVTDTGTPAINVVFLCQYEGGTAVAADPEELASVQWLSPDEITAHPDVPPWTRKSVERAEQRRRGW